MRMVKHWHRLLKMVVDAPSLEVFEAKVDGAWSNLVCHGRQVELDDL